ncbi:MAG: transglycosylase family protein, partial [Actinomycetota bacterium]|nr:transglycosylase family protein [Actinomycetota bacterium]
YYGLYQFSLSTWRAVGGSGNPTDYGYWEQTYRAWKLYQASGRSPWPHCGRYL